MVRWSSAIVMGLIAGVVLAAFLQPRVGAGHSAVLNAFGAGAAVVSQSPGPPVAPGLADRFGISGSVTGLYPGASLPLVLTIANPQNFEIVVTSITTSVGSPNAGCSASNLTVTPFSGSLSVPAKGSTQLTVTVALGHAAPDACQGAVFPLQYSGTAVRP